MIPLRDKQLGRDGHGVIVRTKQSDDRLRFKQLLDARTDRIAATYNGVGSFLTGLADVAGPLGLPDEIGGLIEDATAGLNELGGALQSSGIGPGHEAEPAVYYFISSWFGDFERAEQVLTAAGLDDIDNETMTEFVKAVAAVRDESVWLAQELVS